jgi:hypothetical protein
LDEKRDSEHEEDTSVTYICVGAPDGKHDFSIFSLTGNRCTYCYDFNPDYDNALGDSSGELRGGDDTTNDGWKEENTGDD